ncbi:Resistance protein MG13 [Corchorus olitorius]|uniref:Resistance protein MG13 n=1 Tax=Corchorus olitorius TaxID=93759 RepID=A0A1R3ICS8_9ROSI|nr:Resistance protein MG13 [Corchorus olitorius]
MLLSFTLLSFPIFARANPRSSPASFLSASLWIRSLAALSSLQKNLIHTISKDHFRDGWHKLRYESLDDSKLLETTSLDWNSLSKNPEYDSLYKKLENVGWIGLTQLLNEKASATAVKEFYTSLILKENEYTGKHTWNKEDLFAFICGEEVIVTANMIGLLLKIEGTEGDNEPSKSFDYNDAWETISGKKEKFPDSQAKRKLLNVQAKLLHHFIGNSLWYKQGSLEYINQKDIWLLHCVWTGIKVNLAQIIINEIKKTTSKSSMHCGFGPLVTALGQIAQTKMHQHKDMRVICSPLSFKSQIRFVQTTVKDSQVA